ncbi:ATP-binding protein [Nonomuraea sp. NPDC049419]|uniref:ATP-binding protein n=1 Tax=Nonomuraea sp. NPDC049419 TaxID=3155772 RepID=UPI0034433486
MFVGRTRELALLRGELHAALAGAVRIVAVEGPEGIGKTALIHEALRSSTPGGESGAKGVSTSAVSGAGGVSTLAVSGSVRGRGPSGVRTSGKIYTKLGVGSRVALTAKLHAAGLGERRTRPPGQAADTLIDTA